MKSKNVLSLIGMMNLYRTRPSVLLGIEDEYTAFCLDEACAYIANKIESGEKPMFNLKFKSFKDMYGHFF